MDKVVFKRQTHSYHTTEELKTLRTNIQFSGQDKKVFMVTSCISGEGKSSLAFDLAVSLAELKKKVLILDCDLRNRFFTAVWQRAAELNMACRMCWPAGAS